MVEDKPKTSRDIKAGLGGLLVYTGLMLFLVFAAIFLVLAIIILASKYQV